MDRSDARKRKAELAGDAANETPEGHGPTHDCMFCVEYRRAVARNQQIPDHARMVVTNPILSAHTRKDAPVRVPACATKGCTRPATDKPYDELPATCAEHAAEGDAALLAAIRDAPAPDHPTLDQDETCGGPDGCGCLASRHGRVGGCGACNDCIWHGPDRSDPTPVPPAATGGPDEAEGLAAALSDIDKLPNVNTYQRQAEHLLTSDWLRERDLARDARTRAAALAKLAATRAVLGYREAELLDLKGPCSNKTCRLHYAHSGRCDCIRDRAEREATR